MSNVPTNQPDFPNQDVTTEENQKKKKKWKGWLSKAFSAAAPALAGAGVAMAFKSCAVAALCTAGAPAAVTTAIACAGAGLLVGTLKALWKHHQAKRTDPDHKCWSDQTSDYIAISMVTSTVVGMLTFNFGDQIADALTDKIMDLFGSDSAPVDQPQIQTVTQESPVIIESEIDMDLGADDEIIIEETPETTPETAGPASEPDMENTERPIIDINTDTATDSMDSPVEEPPVEPAYDPKQFLTDLAEQAKDLSELYDALDSYVADNNITDPRFLALVEQAQNGNAQALKDLAATINTEGKILCIDLPKDNALIGQLYEGAMGKGNVQAMIDYAYLQNFGHSGITMNKDNAAALMHHVIDITKDSSRLHEIASCFHDQWTEGFNGNDCVGQTECTDNSAASDPTATVPESTPEQPIDHSSAPETAMQQDNSGMNCTPIIDGGDISFLCEVNDNTDALIQGDEIRIQHTLPRPGF